MNTVIHLEDTGQDLLWLMCNERGVVIEAGPFQSNVWEGSVIPTRSDMCEAGKKCPIHNKHIPYGFLKYKIEKIEQVEI